ncbi:hydroxymethylglutaryl-CoA synthase [Fundicoccus sp. Sow4_F4]|uniref:hydroxymethylglutaryl-CoA synthase n=1 Tax=Fundicoccus sp. Sow4_F4 TaxID=3438783 RepID=UPI003F909BEC
MDTKVGIDKLSVYLPHFYLEMDELAKARGAEVEKYTIGIGQNKMAVPTIQEDIIALGANAASLILDDEDKTTIDQVIFATESSFDFSKAASTYIHELLEIQPFAKSFEVKEACYAATAALQMACDYVRLRPDRKVLVISADESRYGLGTAGEPTQGAGAIAMLISANPQIFAIDMDSISITDNQFDFWRPSYSEFAMVEGSFSTELYQDIFKRVMSQLEETDPEKLSQIKAMTFHLPFTKMGRKALSSYESQEKSVFTKEDKTELLKQWNGHFENSARLNREVGNIYTGSLFLSFLSLLLFSEDIQSGDKVGLFSYGSGAVAELLTGTIQEHYLTALKKESVIQQFNQREAITIDQYEQFYNELLPADDKKHIIADSTKEEGFYLSEVDAHRRYYKYRN